MKVKAITCSECGDTIYSRARHDMRWCSCGRLFVDGGFDYLRLGGPAIEEIAVEDVEVDATEEELYNDWNEKVDKFGRIKKDESQE